MVYDGGQATGNDGYTDTLVHTEEMEAHGHGWKSTESCLKSKSHMAGLVFKLFFPNYVYTIMHLISLYVPRNSRVEKNDTDDG